MPSHSSAEKSVRKSLRNTSINKSRISRIRTFVKKVEDAIVNFGKAPDITKEVISKRLVEAEKELMRGAVKGVLHKNAASRKVSRLNQKARKVTGD